MLKFFAVLIVVQMCGHVQAGPWVEFLLPGTFNDTEEDFRHVDLYDNDIRLAGKTTLNFRVRSGQVGIIALQRDRYDVTNNTVFMILNFHTAASVLYTDAMTGEGVALHTESDILVAYEYRDFWVSWDNGCVEVGKNHTPYTNVFLSWCNLTHDINYISVGAGYEAEVGYSFQKTNFIECYPNQTIHLNNPDPILYTQFTAFYEVDGNRTNCTGTADPSVENILFDCNSTTATITIYISNRSLTEDLILSGKSRAFSFQCLPLDDYNATLSRDLGVSLDTTNESALPTYNITAGFYTSPGTEVTSAEVGDTVYFVITGPVEYDLVPLQCNATGSEGEYREIITDGCSNDESLMLSFNVQSGAILTDYNSTLFVFKFLTSDSLTITCDVRVCVNSSCPISCDGRKRRSIFDRNIAFNPMNDALETTIVGERLNIVEFAFGGSERVVVSLVLKTIMFAFIGFLRVLTACL